MSKHRVVLKPAQTRRFNIDLKNWAKRSLSDNHFLFLTDHIIMGGKGRVVLKGHRGKNEQ